MDEPYEDIVDVLPLEQATEGGMVLLQFQTRSEKMLQIRMKADVARYLGTQMRLQLLSQAQTVEETHPVNEPEDIVAIFAPESLPGEETILLKFQIRSGEMLRLKIQSDAARHLGTQLLLLSAAPSPR